MRRGVFAVEDTAVQLWSGEVVDGLHPATWYGDLGVTTLAPPPGEALSRVAVLSDTHIGASGFGHLPRRRSGTAARDALRSALADAAAWGAALVVVKGDVTDHGGAAEWEAVEAELATSTVPVVVTLGNHDVQRRAVPRPLSPVQVHDVPGIRVIVADSTLGGRHAGLPPVEALEALDHDAPALLCFHHQLQRYRVPLGWPPGIPGPLARRFLDRVAEVNPRTIVTTGHTHRHRVRRHGPVLVSETASTKDFPSTWTGFAVHGGGVRQVARRVSAPEALAWSDSTATSFLAVWGRYAPGRLDDRCYTVAW